MAYSVGQDKRCCVLLCMALRLSNSAILWMAACGGLRALLLRESLSQKLDVEVGCGSWMLELDAEAGCWGWMLSLDVEDECWGWMLDVEPESSPFILLASQRHELARSGRTRMTGGGLTKPKGLGMPLYHPSSDSVLRPLFSGLFAGWHRRSISMMTAFGVPNFEAPRIPALQNSDSEFQRLRKMRSASR